MGLEIVFFNSETQKWILSILAGSNFNLAGRDLRQNCH
jgi:hypothetical protein